LEVKRSWRETDCPPLSSACQEYVELYFHSPNTPPCRGARLQHRDNFIFAEVSVTLCRF